MATLPARELKTEDNLHYVKYGEEENFVLANKGFTNWTESLNANVEDGTQFIGDKSSTSMLMGYSPSIAYGGTVYPGDPFSYWVYQIGKLRKTNQKFTEVEVETWNPVAEKENTYHAYQHEYEVQPSNPGSGEGGGKLTAEGTFASVAEPVEGEFNIQTKTFTPASELNIQTMSAPASTKSTTTATK